jgi:hypothetical protein
VCSCCARQFQACYGSAGRHKDTCDLQLKDCLEDQCRNLQELPDFNPRMSIFNFFAVRCDAIGSCAAGAIDAERVRVRVRVRVSLRVAVLCLCRPRRVARTPTLIIGGHRTSADVPRGRRRACSTDAREQTGPKQTPRRRPASNRPNPHPIDCSPTTNHQKQFRFDALHTDMCCAAHNRERINKPFDCADRLKNLFVQTVVTDAH